MPSGTIAAQTSPDPVTDETVPAPDEPAPDALDDARPTDEAIPGGNRAVVTTTQARFVDTRVGGTTLDGQFEGDGRRSADTEYKVTIAGRGEVPAGAPGVVMYVTAIFPDDVGFFTIHPCLDPRPVVSSVNYTGGVTVGNEVITGLAADGSVCIYTSEGADITVDVGGFLPVGGGGITIASGGRILETREGAPTIDGQLQGIGRTTAGSTTKVRVAGRAGIPAAVDGVVVNVAAVDPADTGFVEVHACETPLPVASKINYTPGVNRANEIISGVDANGDICIFTQHDLDLIVDAVAFVPSLTNFVPVPNARLLETRPGAPTIDGLNEGEGIRAADSEYTLKVTERAGIPADAIAVVANVTGVDPVGLGHATVHPCISPRPNTAALNYTAGVNGATQIIAPLNAAGELCIYTFESMHLLLDVSGYLLPTADLSITKTDDPDPALAGQELTYSVTVANAGPDAATDVVVTDTLPAGVTLVSTSGCDNGAAAVPTCNLGTIAAGASKQYTIKVTVDAATLGQITNSASVASSTNDPDATNNSTSINTLVRGATITIVKDEVPDLGTDYAFTGTLGAFSLDDDADGTLPNAKTFLSVLPGTYTVTETDPTPGSDLTTLVCTDSDASGTASTGDVGTRTATINIEPGEAVTCTFTNTVRGTINIVKGTDPTGGSGFGFTENIPGGSGNFFLDDGQTQTFADVVPGTYTIAEDDPVGNSHDLTGLVCVDSDTSGTASTTVLATRVSTINLDPGETVTCTYTNTRRGTIFIEKRTVGGDATFGFTSTIPSNATFNILTAAGIANEQFLNVPAGSYTVTEDDPTPGYDLTALTCVDPDGGSSVDLGGRTVTIDLDPGELVTCSYENTKRGTINIVKATAPAGGTGFGYTDDIPGSGSFTLDDGQTQTFNDVVPGTYTVTEDDPTPGFDLTALVCVDPDNGSSLDLVGRAATIDLDPGETVTCTYTNTQRGTIVINKASTPAGGTGFGYTDDIPGSGSFTLDDGQTQTITDVTPATYTVTENDPTPGYDLTTLDCVDPDSGSSVNLAAREATIDLDPGETVTCNFGNVQRGTIVVEKQTLPDGDPQSFSFTGTAAGVIGDGGTITVADLMPGAYDATETAAFGWDLTDITCDDTNSTGNTGTATANFVLDPGETVTCTFTNTKRGSIVVEKQTLPDGSPLSFAFTGDVAGPIADDGTLTVFNLVPGNYSSVETVPAGWDLTDITCDDTNSTGNTGTATANFVLDPGETVTCTFTNTEQSTITVVKDFVGTAGTVDLQIDGATAGTGANVGDGGSTGAVVVAAGNRTAGEVATGATNLADYNTSYLCTENSNPASPINGTATSTSNIPVAPGDVWTCTFTNVRKTGTVDVVKDFVGTAGLVDLTVGTTTATDRGDGGSTGAVTLDAGTYTASETAGTGTDLADYNTSYLCTEDSNVASPISGSTTTTGSIPVEDGDAWTCTFTNVRKTGTIEVVKDFVGAPGTVDLQIDGATAGSGANAGDGGTTGAVTVDTGNHTAGEIAAGGTNLADYDPAYNCTEDTNAASPIAGTGTTTINIPVAEGDVWVCTFTNTELGAIVVEKQTDPDAATGSFTFTGDAPGIISDNQQIVVSNLVPGTYTATESDPTVTPGGFDLTAITCDDTNSTGNVATRTATFNVEAGETVTCAFTNTERGAIVVEKQTLPDGDPQSFTFTGTAAGSISDGGTITVTDLVPGPYNATETVPAGWDLTDITCDDTNSTGNTGTATATFNVEPGETVTCTFTNTKRGSITIVKNTNAGNGMFSFDENITGPTGTFNLTTVAGTATTTFTNVAPATYSVTEDDPSPATLTSLTCSDGSSTSIATRTATIGLDPGESVTCTFTNSFDLPPTLDLDADNSGGNSPNFAITFTEDAGPVDVADSDIDITDVVDTNMASGSATITNVQDVGDEFLQVNLASCNPIVVTGNGTFSITLTGSAPIATYEACLASLTYENTSDTPTAAPARTVDVLVNDGTANSPTRMSTITVVPVNDDPNAVNDLYTGVPVNVVLDAGTGTPGIDVDVPDGVLTQGTDDSDPEGSPLSVSAIIGCADVTAPFANCPTNGGGTVTMNANGTFTYVSQAGENISTDTFTYTVSDGSGGTDNGLVTIQFAADTIWFVDDPGGAPGGSGRSNDPFRTIGDINTANAAGGTNDPADSDIVYLQTGTHNDASLSLRNGQELIGEGVALNSGLLSIPAGTRPTLSPAANGVNLAAGNTVRGLNVGNTAGTGINGASVAGLTINDVAITATATGGGIDIANGSNGAVTLDSITTQGGDGIKVTNIGGTQTFTVTGATDINSPSGDGIDIGGSDGTTFSFSTIDIDGGTANGIDIDGGVGGFTVSTSTQIDGQAGDGIEISNSTTDVFSFGDTDIGQNNSTGSNDGIDVLTNNGSATFTFADLKVTNANGVGIRSGPGTINLGGATNTVSSTNGAALQSNGTNLGAGWNFTSLTSNNSALDGIYLEGINQSVTVSGKVDIDNPADQGVEIINSGGNVAINTDDTANEGLEIDEAGDHSIRLNGNTGTFTVRRGHARNNSVLNNHAEDGIEITNVIGAVSISGASGDLFEIRDHADNTGGGGTDGRHAVIADNSGNVTLDFIHIRDHGDFGADLNLEHGIYWFQPRDNAVLTVTNSTIETVNDGNGIRMENDIALANPSNTGTLTAVIQDNIIRGDQNTATFDSTEFGVEGQFRGGADVDLTIGDPAGIGNGGNTFFDLDEGVFILINGSVGTSGSPAKVRIDGNDIDDTFTDGIDVEYGDVIDVGATFVDTFIRGNDIDDTGDQGIVGEWLDDDGGEFNFRITDNTVDNTDDEGIFILNTDTSNSTGIVLVDNNSVGLSGTGSVNDEGIEVRNRGMGTLDLTTTRNISNDNFDHGIEIRNDFSTSGAFCLNPGLGTGNGNSGTGNTDPDYDVRRTSNGFSIEGLTPASASDLQTETYLATINSTNMDATGGPFTSVAAGACQTPPTS